MSDDQEIQNGESLVQEETRVPLISQEKRRFNNGDEEQPTKGSIREDTFMVYATTFVTAFGSYACGLAYVKSSRMMLSSKNFVWIDWEVRCYPCRLSVGVGYSSPTQSAIREDVHLSLAEYSMFGSILTFGAMFGAITSGKIADYIGRKWTMLLSSGFCTAGWLFIYFAQEAILLDIGRLATGYGTGVFSYMVPIFIAEVAPKDLRGMLTTICWVMLCAGVSVPFILGTILTWRALALTGIIPCAIVFCGLFTIPESPRWLAKRGNQKEFEASLRRLRGKNADISEEAAEIQDYIETLEKLPKAKLLDLFQKRYRRPVTIGVGLMVCQQFGGINGICFYTSSIFESAGFPANVGNIIYAILPVIISALSAFFIDGAGRKPLIVISGAGLVIGCLLTGISFFLKEHGLARGAAPALAVTGILVYVGAFSMGMGVIPWMMMSEIFPIDIKGVAGNFVTLVNWFGAWVCTLTFNFLMSWSSYGTFILYAAINALAIVFVIKVVPETKDRTLEQIHATINSS